MAKFKELEAGVIGLIMQQKDGRITQIGLTVEQSNQLQIFLAILSKDQKLIFMPSEYDLILKSKANGTV